MKGLDATQVEQLRQIAEYLHYERQQKAISLEKVASDTFIPLRLLQALESAQLERLPEPVYVQGFIRRYADALGLDGWEVANAFQIEPAPDIQPDAAVEPPPPAKPIPVSDAHYEPANWSEEPGRSYLPLVLSGVVAVAVVGAIAVAAFNQTNPPSSTSASKPQNSPQRSPDPSSAEKPSTSTAQESPSSAAPNPALAPETKPETSAEPIANSVQVDISLTDQSWLEVVADGKTKFEGTLAKGDQRTWKAEKNLMIRAGNAGAVVASFNQGEAKPLGKAGDVVDVTFPRKRSN